MSRKHQLSWLVFDLVLRAVRIAATERPFSHFDPIEVRTVRSDPEGLKSSYRGLRGDNKSFEPGQIEITFANRREHRNHDVRRGSVS